ncbi:MAG: phytoene/squalene synthase family protein [Acidobacteria bacterium]|nr:phytoene/squalene synthase family protein [Acidobacteriota bacterium]
MPAPAAALDPSNNIEALFEQAAAATATGSKSFYFATRFFPKLLAKRAYAVYWFCRTTDDLVDEAASIEQGTQALDAWEAELRFGLKGGSVSNPILRLFLIVVADCNIPAEYPLELVAGCRMDLEQQRYATYDDLRLFCYRVASCVGLMMCHVIGFTNPALASRAKQHAIDLGIAMQITNILRDVGTDLELGRIYFPLEDMQRFGYTEDDLRNHRRNKAFRDLMQFEATRARSYYSSAMPGIEMLKPEGRFAVEIAAKVYAAILREIERANYDVFSRRAVVSSAEKYWITAKALTSAWWAR